jgi:hypothetical protein
MTDPLYTPVIDGYSGFPMESHTQCPPAGSVEWHLDAVERHAIAGQHPLAQYEYLRTASDDPVIALVMQLILDDEERHPGDLASTISPLFWAAAFALDVLDLMIIALLASRTKVTRPDAGGPRSRTGIWRATACRREAYGPAVVDAIATV